MIAHAPIPTTRTQGRPQRLRYAGTIRSAHERRSHRPTPDDRSETWLRNGASAPRRHRHPGGPVQSRRRSPRARLYLTVGWRAIRSSRSGTEPGAGPCTSSAPARSPRTPNPDWCKRPPRECKQAVPQCSNVEGSALNRPWHAPGSGFPGLGDVPPRGPASRQLDLAVPFPLHSARSMTWVRDRRPLPEGCPKPFVARHRSSL